MSFTQCLDETNSQSLLWKQVLSAVFYGVASFMITVINKTVLTTYQFPSFQVLGIGQMVATILVLFIGKKLRIMLKIHFKNQLPCLLVNHVVRMSTTCDSFEADFSKNHVHINNFQRSLLSIGSAFMSLVDPHRADMIACLGETTGERALQYMLLKMENSEEGAEILRTRPRINSRTVDLDYLKRLPLGTLGKTYMNFLEHNKVTPDSRMMVQFIDDVNTAYVLQRYREAHDLFHAVLGMPTNMLGEVTVKWVEAIQTKLPMCIGGAIFGPIRLKPKHRQLYVKYYLPWAIETGNNSRFLLNIFFEKRWEQPLSELHTELNITPIVLPQK